MNVERYYIAHRKQRLNFRLLCIQHLLANLRRVAQPLPRVDHQVFIRVIDIVDCPCRTLQNAAVPLDHGEITHCRRQPNTRHGDNQHLHPWLSRVGYSRHCRWAALRCCTIGYDHRGYDPATTTTYISARLSLPAFRNLIRSDRSGFFPLVSNSSNDFIHRIFLRSKL